MRVLLTCVALFALSACNGTDFENKGQEIGAKADDAVSDVTNATDNLEDDIENVADRADNAIEGAADSVDRQIGKVENAAEAAERELEK